MPPHAITDQVSRLSTFIQQSLKGGNKSFLDIKGKSRVVFWGSAMMPVQKIGRAISISKRAGKNLLFGQIQNFTAIDQGGNEQDGRGIRLFGGAGVLINPAIRGFKNNGLISIDQRGGWPIYIVVNAMIELIVLIGQEPGGALKINSAIMVSRLAW